MNPASEQSRLYRAVIEYDGTRLLGFQIQRQGRTVQGEVERVLHRLTQSRVRVAGAGRTDAGVHARGQVIAFRASWSHSLADLHRAVNALLPDDVSFLSLDIAPEGFHPRFSAIKRCYRYQIGLWPGHSPLRSRYVWELGPGLDVSAMQQAADDLLGSHDFMTFGQPPQGKITIRRIFSATWQSQPPYLYFDLCANAFLRRMVRNITAALIQVGQRQSPAEYVASLILAKDRSLAPPPAPAKGLILTKVFYPSDEEI
ncbi:MAG: tRNA pseudouridine(38-40) synthase TruA [Clostridia bacterium]|nr:MAG: tRNA pseudouridine(38-40) synthase TruA [Clostridia bacterium]